MHILRLINVRKVRIGKNILFSDGYHIFSDEIKIINYSAFYQCISFFLFVLAHWPTISSTSTLITSLSTSTNSYISRKIYIYYVSASILMIKWTVQKPISVSLLFFENELCDANTYIYVIGSIQSIYSLIINKLQQIKSYSELK